MVQLIVVLIDSCCGTLSLLYINVTLTTCCELIRSKLGRKLYVIAAIYCFH
jgi:hypothetical protein